MKRRIFSRPPRPVIRPATPPHTRRGNSRAALTTGKLVIYPTESFYALGVDATNPKAITKLFKLKHREPGKPIALIASDLNQVKKFFFVPTAEMKLAKKYWPGALTILLRPKRAIAADSLLGTTPAGRMTGHPSYARRGDIRIGVRVPAHTGARKLAKKFGAPLTATSANISGQPPTKSAAVVKRSFPGIMIAPGRCGRATKPSTVIEVKRNSIFIIRPGAIRV